MPVEESVIGPSVEKFQVDFPDTDGEIETVWVEGAFAVSEVITAPAVLPSKSAPVRLIVDPGSALRSQLANPFGTSVVGKLPATHHIFVLGEMAAVCKYDRSLDFPSGPLFTKSAAPAMAEDFSYDASATPWMTTP